MLSITLAQKLKAAGLAWTPAKKDFFAIPDRGLDEMIFVISDMTVFVETLKGQLAVTFHGAVEWALDYIMVGELVWLPTEAQLRELLEQRLIGEPEPRLTLNSTADGYCCTIQFHGDRPAFEAFGASEAYGLALLHVLENSP
ncbi:MAG: pilus assembly protein CpaE [Anaerolineae bacterium]|nr:pilus assembly protein CpaE [Anaerolineae bacterium]